MNTVIAAAIRCCVLAGSGMAAYIFLAAAMLRGQLIV